MDCYGDESLAPSSKPRGGAKVFMEGWSVVSRLLALITLAIYLPVLAVVGGLVLLTSPGPVCVKKAYKRRNMPTQIVYLYEFRTECWHTWRETPTGRFLRLADLHRLPRLLNVLRGDLAAGERVQRLDA